MEQKFDIIAKTFFGLEDVLAKEVEELGGENIEKQNRAVKFNGDKAMLYRSNYYLRTALKILKPIYIFKAKTEDELYKKVYDFNWEEYMNLKTRFAFDAVVFSEHFKHSRYAALKAKDAIVDSFRDKYDKRPYVDPENPQLLLNLHISEDNVTISLDSSGESLHKRGYRLYQDVAPINEVLAAGMIKLSDWKGDSNFIDPMCGSGTILIEAAMIAHNIAPGVFRKEFGFENWLDYDPDLFDDIADEQDEKSFDYSIIGSDLSAKAIRIANENVKNAGLTKKIELYNQPIEKILPPENGGLVITNPPYGERIQPRELLPLYKAMGDSFKNNFQNYDVWVISSSIPALKNIGLQTSRKIKLINGKLECKYQKYEIYEGSKKAKYN